MTETTKHNELNATVSIGDLTVPRIGYGAMQLTGPGVIAITRMAGMSPETRAAISNAEIGPAASSN